MDDDEDKYGDTLWDRINSRLYAVLDPILELRANTQEGLKLQARAAAIAASNLWDGTPPPDTHEKAFIESACSFFDMDAEAIAGLALRC